MHIAQKQTNYCFCCQLVQKMIEYYCNNRESVRFGRTLLCRMKRKAWLFRMDVFMDKLAQKLNAQEIIRANSAAETEELNQLKNQLAEYNKCLDQMKALIEEGSAKLEAAKVDGDAIDTLVKESIEKIESIQQSTEALDELKVQLLDKLQGTEGSLAQKLDDMDEKTQAGLESTCETVHKECVKVYRNVQAVVVDESGKQKESIEEISYHVDSVKGKINAVLGISITALILSLAGVACQVLEMLNISLF